VLFLYSNEDRRCSTFGAVWSSNGIGIWRSGCEGDSHRAHLDDPAFHDRLSEFDRHCFSICAHRAFIGALFITVAICWFDARQKQLQSATGTTPSGNRRQRRRIRTIWLWHGRAPGLVQAGAQLGLSVTDACGRTDCRMMIALDVRSTN